jgi:hypothetical protein
VDFFVIVDFLNKLFIIQRNSWIMKPFAYSFIRKKPIIFWMILFLEKESVLFLKEV